MPTPERDIQVLTPAMRRILVAAAILVALAGIQLFIFSERTEEYFAWTVVPPLTAAFLGSAYWASAVVEWQSSRAGPWAQARVAVPSVFTFTTLTLVVTLVHLDKFHLGADFSPHTRAVTWAWIAVYAIVPVAMAVLWLRQRRVPGTDPPRTHPLPIVLLAVVAVIGLGLLGYGSWLLVDPNQAGAGWPWPLTPLTARAVGAWLVGLGVSAAQTVLEGDARRARPVAVGAITLATLGVISLVRFRDDVTGPTSSTAVMVAALAVWAAIGAAILAVASKPRVEVGPDD